MKLELFDNQMGFKPTGKVLDYWKFLPQARIDKDVPSLFGNIKSMFIPNLIVIILILCEVGLFWQLNEDGVGFMTLLALSVFDFVIGLLPAIIFIYGNLIKSDIQANIFIIETNLKSPNNVPLKYQDNENAYHNDLKADLYTYKSKLMTHHIIEFALALIVIAVSAWKFASIYEVFGSDILIMPVGRYVIVVLILSIITHIFFTKTVFANLIFRMSLSAQKKEWEKSSRPFNDRDRNKMKEVTYVGKYNYETASNQVVARKFDSKDVTIDDKLREIKTNDEIVYISTRKTDNHNGVNLIYTGLLTDPELAVLASAQPNSTERTAILATGKRIQLDFN